MCSNNLCNNSKSFELLNAILIPFVAINNNSNFCVEFYTVEGTFCDKTTTINNSIIRGFYSSA